MKDASQLLDLLSVSGSDDIEPTVAAAGRQALYPDVRSLRFVPASYQSLFKYLSTSTLLAGIKAGQLHQGHFNANQYNYLEVTPSLIDTDLM